MPVLNVAHSLAGGPLPSEIDGSAVGCASDLRLTGNGESDPTGLAPALGNDWPLDGVSMEPRPRFLSHLAQLRQAGTSMVCCW